jgi:hypothetical protein
VALAPVGGDQAEKQFDAAKDLPVLVVSNGQVAALRVSRATADFSDPLHGADRLASQGPERTICLSFDDDRLADLPLEQLNQLLDR